MPLVRIDLSATRPPAARRAIADGVHRALVDAVGVPAGDRFQIVTPHDPEEMFFDPSYLGVAREDVVCVQVLLRAGRPEEVKRGLYRRLADELAEAGVRPEDVFVTLSENSSDDWSMGNGLAQLADQAAAAARSGT
ncbi:tautomerase family protein [Streptomyces sp. B1866]|uniref:tautomerase family protein n=1 Tax=Streptomyces sp. B1866 TaxID=3075431 RepID=UPI00288F3C83|nr:tautomerase family protein [Streptomyces sp. B1866]MDT3396177.1 tautomerase family protein [Streptomyces sp. B1866]